MEIPNWRVRCTETVNQSICTELVGPKNIPQVNLHSKYIYIVRHYTVIYRLVVQIDRELALAYQMVGYIICKLALHVTSIQALQMPLLIPYLSWKFLVHITHACTVLNLANDRRSFCNVTCMQLIPGLDACSRHIVNQPLAPRPGLSCI